jgi:putative acetyltransferase
VPHVVRPARDDDAAGLIALVGAVFAEYPGCVLDVDGELPELRRIASAFAELGGRFWVAERDGAVVGSAGWVPATAPGGVELRKLYVHRSERRSGLGSRLHDLVLAEAGERGAVFVDLWSDTRFVTAHRFYEKRGYARGPSTRELHDRSATVEYYFRLSRAITPRSWP